MTYINLSKLQTQCKTVHYIRFERIFGPTPAWADVDSSRNRSMYAKKITITNF